MNKKIIPLYILLLCALVAAGISLYRSYQERVAYVQLSEVYENFTLKKTLQPRYDAAATHNKQVLDSLQLVLEGIKRAASAEGKVTPALQQQYDQAETYFFYQKQEGEKELKTMEEELNAQIWAQINQYVKEYGEAQGYDYVLGADGSGSIMYAHDRNDRTKEVIQYINEKYEGR